MNLENTQTLKNLARAFATELHDGARYQFLRQQAETQQLNYVANTLKTLATNEMAHARIWWDLITDKDKVSFSNIDLKVGFSYETGSFAEQFGYLADIERKEGNTLYIGFAKTARKEGFEDIAKKFEMTAEVEKIHSDMLEQLYEGLQNGTLYKKDSPTLWTCTKCGHEASGKNAWKTCALCMEPQGYADAQIE